MSASQTHKYGTASTPAAWLGLALWCSTAGATQAGDEPAGPTVREPDPPGTSCLATAKVNIAYELVGDSASANQTELWYTADRGQTWRQWPAPASRSSPIEFEAAADGLYGFYLVLRNDAGASAERPRDGTPPQTWVRVDRTAPLVQVLKLTPDDRFDVNRLLHLRWRVEDESLPDRPVAIHYRTPANKVFQRLADCLPGESALDWTVPTNLAGRLEIRITATDLAENEGRYVADWLVLEGEHLRDTRPAHTLQRADAPVEGDIPSGRVRGGSGQQSISLASDSPPTSKTTSGQTAPTTLPPPFDEPNAGSTLVATTAADEARKLYDLGTWHRLRGEYDVAIARLRQALESDPELLAARNDLAGLLFLQGESDAAEGEFRRVLEQSPRYTPALKSLAFLQARKRNYRSAEELLQKLLLLEPNDAEAWLHLGDIRMFRGDRAAAREAWQKAASIDAASEEVKQRAGRRLELYSGSGVQRP